MVPDLTGVAAGGTTTYTFTATPPGTYLYEAGLLPNASTRWPWACTARSSSSPPPPGQA